ncbi:VOC family protein [Piscibacillus halophilus]|uniref:VOC domain-containing protein n=1 Tax=Piscibacillus halophilus TaxID=571933 RepID=A0A1H9IL46_9BACI|nr:VOC family protein [Piscibacillus halophilus]SEQ75333.1 hypothetical protein SAMN05216362_12536 [Piscibacillus halophilus]
MGETVKNSVKNRIGAVFVIVNNMPRAVKWYRELLDLPNDDEFVNNTDPHIKTIYPISLENTELLLDSMHREEIKPSENHLFFFDTDNIEETYQAMESKGVNILSPIEGDGGVKFFTIEDSEGNRIMFCEEK